MQNSWLCYSDAGCDSDGHLKVVDGLLSFPSRAIGRTENAMGLTGEILLACMWEECNSAVCSFFDGFERFVLAKVGTTGRKI